MGTHPPAPGAPDVDSSDAIPCAEQLRRWCDALRPAESLAALYMTVRDRPLPLRFADVRRSELARALPSFEKWRSIWTLPLDAEEEASDRPPFVRLQERVLAVIQKDPIVSRECLRIGALIAYAAQLHGDDTPSIERERRARAVAAWIDAIVSEGDAESEAYFPLYLDTATEVGTRGVQTDPYEGALAELALDLPAPGAPHKTIAHRALGAHADRVLLPAAHWALRRYAFDLTWQVTDAGVGLTAAVRPEAQRQIRGRLSRMGWRVRRAWGLIPEDPTPTERSEEAPAPALRPRRAVHRGWRGLILQNSLLPRLFCAVLLGLFALAFQAPVLRFLGRASAACWPMVLLVAMAMLLIVALVVWEVRQRCLLRSTVRTATRKIVATGYFYSLVLALGAVGVARRAHPEAATWEPSGSLGVALYVLGLATAALLLGYILQLIWDDKALSDGF